MKLHLIILALCVFTACQNKNQNSQLENTTYPFYVGTYNTDESKGIYRYLLLSDGKLEEIGLAAVSDNPSYLAMSHDRKFLLTTNENNIEGTGTIESFSIKNDSLIFMSRSPSGGAHPCFISISKDGYVLAANYTGGNIGLLRLTNKGELSDLLDVQQHSGSGTTDRQKSPHAHAAKFNPVDNSIISVDLGTNELWFSHLDTVLQKLLPADPQKLMMNRGAGPRHLSFHSNGKWVYVVNELDCTVTLLSKNDSGEYEKDESISTLPVGYVDPNTCADIHISSDGKFLYASNRGHNSIAIFEINANNGLLKIKRHQSTYGEWPRNFSLSPDGNFLLVANQHSNNIVSFKRNKANGLLEYISEIKAPSPVCILF